MLIDTHLGLSKTDTQTLEDSQKISIERYSKENAYEPVLTQRDAANLCLHTPEEQSDKSILEDAVCNDLKILCCDKATKMS